MGKKNHSDKPIDAARELVGELNEDDTRYGVGTTHRGLPEKKKYAQERKSGNWRDHLAEYEDDEGPGQGSGRGGGRGGR